jgi:hypothetical protein
VKSLLLIGFLLRVWWGILPDASGIFIRRIGIPAQDGTSVSYLVVRKPDGLFLVAEADVVKTDTVKED